MIDSVSFKIKTRANIYHFDFLRIEERKKQKDRIFYLVFKMASKDELKTLTESILASRSNTKQIPDLIKALDDPALTKIALNSLLKVFTNLCQISKTLLSSK